MGFVPGVGFTIVVFWEFTLFQTDSKLMLILIRVCHVFGRNLTCVEGDRDLYVSIKR